MTSIHITPAEELCDAWDAAANESHSLTDVITTGDIVVGAKAMRRLKKAIEAITGCQPGILADYRGPAPTPPVTGRADGLVEPGPALPNGLIGGRNVNNRLMTLENRITEMGTQIYDLSARHREHRRMIADIPDTSGWAVLHDKITDLHRQVENNNRLYGLFKGRLDGVDEDHTELAGQVQALRDDLTALTERFEAHSHEIDIHSTDRPTALAGHLNGRTNG